MYENEMEKSYESLDETEMRKLLKKLTRDEKADLYELLSALAQNPGPAKSLQVKDFATNE